MTTAREMCREVIECLNGGDAKVRRLFCASCAQRLYPFYRVRELNYNESRNTAEMDNALRVLWGSVLEPADISSLHAILNSKPRLVPSFDDLSVKTTFLAHEAAFVVHLSASYFLTESPKDLNAIATFYIESIFNIHYYLTIWSPDRALTGRMDFEKFQIEAYNKEDSSIIESEVFFIKDFLDDIDAEIKNEIKIDLSHYIAPLRAISQDLF